MIVTWSSYDFDVYLQNGAWNDVAGIYIFSYQTQGGSWFAVYVGQTESFANRIPNHERWREAVRLGATHVHAMTVPQPFRREVIEQELIRLLQPQLNEVYR